MMYIPPEDNIEQEETLDDEMKNKENISSDNGLTMEHDENAGSKQRFGGLNRSKLENDAAATVEAARKYAKATAKAALTAEETAKKLQNVVTEKTIIGKLDKEQAKFKNEVNASNLTACILPWSDLPDQWIAKKHILSLSLDTRNFTRDPPSETNFDFICVQSVAAALLEEDPNLRKIRFQLVPKRSSKVLLNEERFWRNYFYRISLVRQAALGESSLSVAEVPVFSRAIEKEESLKSCDPKDNVQEQKVEENEDKVSKISMKEQNDIENVDKIREDFERDLINSFNDYELVSDETDKTDEQWEEEITELLNSA
ncbi:hypothetical protein DINM_003668 [Dirofilaria immitis]|nr:hypothetical protein [Dirofilaria immitis]